MTRRTVALADDHRMVLEGIGRLLESDYEVVGAVESGEELLALVEERRPDLVVADVSMPGLGGIEALRRIRAGHPDTRVVMLSMHDDETYAAAALRAGASGYVLKHADPAELLDALRAALAGEVFVSSRIASDVLRLLGSGEEAPHAKLSDRQREVLRLLVQGRSLKQVAFELGISAKTVEYHKYRMMEQLGIGTSAELIRFGVESGVDEL